MKILTAKAVVELAQLRVNLAVLSRQEKELANDLKDTMIERGLDEFAPRNIPLKLIKLEYDQTKDSFYEQMAIKAFKHIHGALWRAELERERDKFPKREVVALRIVAGNENYQQPEVLEKKAG